MKASQRNLALAIGLASCCPTFTQAAFYDDVTSTHLPPQLAGACMNAAAGDADGDGDLDLALAMEFQTKILLLNDGAGTFTDASERLPRAVHDSEDVAFADFDGDGALDLVFVSEDDRTDELYLNDGSGRYTDASARLTTDDVTNGLVLMDLNGDGREDVLTANIGSERALISDGQGGFKDETDARWPQQGESRTQALATGDVDGDGDLDVIAANEGQNQLYLNEGGRLVDVTATHLPVDADETRDIRAVDVDGDADIDLIIANVAFLSQESPQDYVLLNDGTGKFTRAQPGTFPEDARSNFTLQTLDIDRDGDIDAIAPSTVFAEAVTENILLVRDAAGKRQALRASDMYIDDFDANGMMDVRITSDARTVTLLNDGEGLVYPADEDAWPAAANGQVLDIDSNNQPDTALVRIGSSLLRSDDESAANGRRQNLAYQLVDLGLDGSVDIIAPVVNTMDRVGDYQVLLNDGNGNFAVAPEGSVLPASAVGNGFDVEVADFDADGFDDLFLCNRASVTDAAAASGGLQRLLRGVAP